MDKTRDEGSKPSPIIILLPEEIDLIELDKALNYLESIEAFHLSRRGLNVAEYDFDSTHYKLLRKCIKELQEIYA